MSNMSEDLGVALVKEVCPICCKEMDGPIIIGNTFDKKNAEKVNSMNGKVVGFADKPCPKCQKLIDEGCFFIIGVDVDKTDDYTNPYRSGHIVGITKDCDFYNMLPEECKKSVAMLMNYKDMIKVGLINEA